MSRNLSIAACVALLAVTPPVSAAPEPEVLARNGKWEVSYDEDACQLYAQFGDAKDPAYLKISRYSLGDSFDLAMYGKRFRLDGGSGAVRIAFKGGTPVEATAMFGKAGDLPIMMVSGIRLDGWVPKSGDGDAVAPPVTPAMEDAVTEASFSINRRKPVILQTGSLRAPMSALRKCVDDLVRHWGFDPAVQSSLSRPPRPVGNRQKWFDSSDYPAAAQRMGAIGRVKVRVDVAADGSVSGCRVLFRTNPDEFADLTCELIRKRGKFEPALDAAGTPVRSLFLMSTSWMLHT